MGNRDEARQLSSGEQVTDYHSRIAGQMFVEFAEHPDTWFSMWAFGNQPCNVAEKARFDLLVHAHEHGDTVRIFYRRIAPFEAAVDMDDDGAVMGNFNLKSV